MLQELRASKQHPLIMGIVNVTPDSFSDGGRLPDSAAVLRQAESMLAAGVDIIDVGGESTRPFSDPVSAAEELQRVIPAVRAIRNHFSVPISVDTTKAEVAHQALDAGADIVNDISACRFDTAMIPLIREWRCPLVIMHMQGNPKTMQRTPSYTDVVRETRAFLKQRIIDLRNQGFDGEIVIDPGLGFGKTVAHNLSLLRQLAVFKNLGCPLLVGHSRKSFIGKLLDLDIDQRDEATAVLSLLCALNGADMLRVHDVKRTMQALHLAAAVQQAP